uniref:Uncharacterized protein n=1 Tax=Arundo donax TaxID=35708 RepID=A0A0A9EDI9_ARUDO
MHFLMISYISSQMILVSSAQMRVHYL